MKTKPHLLFAGLLATGLFNTNVQAQTASAHGASQAQGAGSTQVASAATDQAGTAAQGGIDAAGHASANASAQAVASGGAAVDVLARRYAEAAGSVDAATALVGELGSGANAMAAGEIDTTLALASNLVTEGGAANLDGAVDAVLDLRANGLGWGQVADRLDLNLGTALSAAHGVSGALGDSSSQPNQSGAAPADNMPASVDVAGAGQSGVGVNVGTAGIVVGGNASGDAAASGRTRSGGAAAGTRANGRIGVGADVRPTLPNLPVAPLVRPLLGGH